MLNYIWISLIVIGIGVAVYTDIHDLSTNKYENDVEETASIVFLSHPSFPLKIDSSYSCSVKYLRRGLPIMTRDDFGPSENSFKKLPIAPQQAELILSTPTDTFNTLYKNGVLHIHIDKDAPQIWKDRLSAVKNSDFLLTKIEYKDMNEDTIKTATLTFGPVKFVKLNQVTNDGIVKNAKTAVELAIGLIGIMALWLGVMKVAEQAGLVAKLASLLKPATVRLFPDVPPDHPAMGAMIMNISANMLGLSNAATPFGIKAMEELNKLNNKLGTATDAMCTFLVINTSNVQLIPATVIAIRAASGSAYPTEILGPALVSTAVALTVGVTVVKVLSRLPIFKRQLEIEVEGTER